MVVRELSRFFGVTRCAVSFGGSDDGLVAVHFDYDGGIPRDFARVERSNADDYTNS